MRAPWLMIGITTAAFWLPSAQADERMLDKDLHHLRYGEVREWSEFPEKAEGPQLAVRFRAQKNVTEYSLRVRQQDVKQPWRVLLNNKELGRLDLDENDAVVYLAVPPGRLLDGENSLTIEQTNRIADDIRVGEIAIVHQARMDVLSESSVEVHVFDSTNTEDPLPTPCRITIVNSGGALTATSAVSNESLAARTGVIYTANGQAQFGLPAGDYTIYAGRGFEYGIASARLSLARGDNVRKELAIRREVPTEGYVSCDTHIHTLTYSGHGDATIDERVITIAGEGIELPIAADHNRHIDYEPMARRHNVRQFFTPVIGNEVTTSVGHYNIFPVQANEPVPEFQSTDGNLVLDSIAERTTAKAIVLNHPRDVHRGFRPFGPERHNTTSGENSAGWLRRAVAVEMVNSGAQQTDVMRPYADWFGLLSRGLILTPVGASDSHDVSRFIVGQARTYIRCRDDRPDQINIDEAVQSFVEGRVLVSCGLLVDMSVNGKYGPGDLIPAGEQTSVSVRVLGPSWTKADNVTLFVNGAPFQEEAIQDTGRAGVKWEKTWTLPRYKHDVHLAAVATGPGVESLFWPIAKPYQPTSPVVRRRVIGSTGAVWLDFDRDGKRTSAFDYATRLIAKHDRAADVVTALADYDEAVAVQAAAALRARGRNLDDAEIQGAVKIAGSHVARGFRAFLEAEREGTIARSQSP